MMEGLAIAERRILRKVSGTIKEGDQYRRRYNNELYKHIEKITNSIRKRSITFYRHPQRINSYRVTGRIFKYITELKIANTSINETENDIEEFQITHEDIIERIPLRNKLLNFKGFQEKNPEENRSLWTEERRGKHKERMRDMEEKERVRM